MGSRTPTPVSPPSPSWWRARSRTLRPGTLLPSSRRSRQLCGASLVAQGASPQGLFQAVAEEVGRLLPVGSATMGRFEPDGSITTVASWSTTEAAFPTGRRWPTEGTNVAWTVLQTGRSARLDDFSAATDPIGVTARDAGIKSAVGSPVVVKGHLWGVMTATSTEGRCRRAPSAPHFAHGARRDGDRERGKPVRARCLAPTHCRGIGRDSPEDRAPPGGSG
jgi:GAF domain-containing protein